ncbi:MAG: DUF2442 domain-containing protein [Actinomycetaceae bacterium]|nr:DUF2442 domain-containing protein [Actinomycetaceae bacterium]
MEPDVIAVEGTDTFGLLLTYANGEQRLYDMSPMLQYAYFAPLRDIDFFKKNAHPAYGTVSWGNRIDIAPEELYHNSTRLNYNK